MNHLIAKLLVFVALVFAGFTANAQAISIASLNNALNEMARSGAAVGFSPLIEVLEQAGYHSVKCSDWRGNNCVNLYAKNCKVKRLNNQGRGDEAYYQAVSPTQNASIAEILCSGDGTFLELRIYVYGKPNALKWVNQLKKAGYKCPAPGGLMGFSAWQYDKPGRDTITIWQRGDKSNTYVLIVDY